MTAEPFYSLGMFPYPSGTPHLGHVRVYTISDVRARHARLHGREVLHPMGWDAFGLPAENAAIARGLDPAEWTRANIAQMRATFERMGWGFDWDRELSTADPSYYRWTQWLFLQLHARGLAERVEGWVHWCPSCATVLADEQVIDGACWRCEAAVTREQRPQWTLKITAYAQRLWDDLERLEGWDRRAVAVQRSWIGRSEGAVARFGPIEVFTTRIDTLFGTVAVVVAPEHGWVRDCADAEVQAYAARARSRTAVERMSAKVRTGVPLGRTVPHPLTGEAVPVWVADYVIGDYGTGAVMCVPAHDERDFAFAAEVGLPVRQVVAGPEQVEGAFTDDGVLVDSGPFTGLTSAEARTALGAALAEVGRGGPRVSWNLRDWSVGRQRGWGCPIPMVHCPSCGHVPVPEAELPVRLDDPAERPCPGCGGVAVRETDTLDTFVCSSWYAFRFVDPHNDAEPFARAPVDRALPIDVYVGAIDHAAQHMLYFRFVTKVLHDLGHIGFDEPVAGFVCNGMVLGHDGRKMSKSTGNGVDPTELLDQWGADALRLGSLADTPVDRDVLWDSTRVEARARFLKRFGAAISTWLEAHPEPEASEATAEVAACIARLDTDIAANALHVAVARLHELAHTLRPVLDGPDAAGSVRDVLRAAWPLVPGWVEALWPPSFGALEGWPEAAEVREERVRIGVQVDGRRVGQVEVPVGADADAVQAAAEVAVQRRLNGRPIVRVVLVPGRLVNLVTA